MIGSPTWLDDMARGAARRQLRARQLGGPVAEWGAPRLSRRTTIGSAATAMVAVSAVRHVSPAFAQGGKPECVDPCLAEAGRNRDGAYDVAASDARIQTGRLHGQKAGLEAQLRKTKSKAKRAKILAQINAINVGLSQAVIQEIKDQFNADKNFENNRRRCLSSNECGDPAKYPGGKPAQPGAPGTGGGTQSCPADTAPCNCGGDVNFLCCLKYFSCKECCG